MQPLAHTPGQGHLEHRKATRLGSCQLRRETPLANAYYGFALAITNIQRFQAPPGLLPLGCQNLEKTL